MKQTTDAHLSSPFRPEFFVTIDFDGTISRTDVTDAVIRKFARDGWQEAEELWEAGQIGSRECLARQMALIDAPLAQIIAYAATQPIDPAFAEFMDVLNSHGIPYAILSDGFTPIIRGILAQAGLQDIPVYASDLSQDKGKVKTFFANTSASCHSGTCKCRTAALLAGDLPIVHIGDGRSDFCIAQKAAYVFCRGKLTGFCVEKELAHSPFMDFSEVSSVVRALLIQQDWLLREQAPKMPSQPESDSGFFPIDQPAAA